MQSKYLFNLYGHKIKDAKYIFKKVGSFPRKKKVVFCHGNFDIVHPGHVRHLSYAKSKGTILIASITADRFIKKGIHRPHVPQNLRAINLAAFEMVDFVLIDHNKEPLKNLKIIKPDFFAKGFEYSVNSMPTATVEENKVVKNYGGKMIFTPGDVVYSSTRLLKTSSPLLKNEKLLSLMEENSITFKKLKKIIKNFKNYTITLVGDTIVDTHTKTDLIGGNTKTPTPSVLFKEKVDYLGGACAVANHIRSTGASVNFCTVLGNDPLKKYVLRNLKKKGIVAKAIVDQTRPNVNKNTIITDEYRMIKIDTVDNTPINKKIIDKFSNFIKKNKSDAVVFSDFRHGIFHKSSIPILVKSIPKGKFKVADSQVATRWGNINDFKNFDLVTPTEKEVRFSLADQDSNLSRLAEILKKGNGYNNLILKSGKMGIFCVGEGSQKNSENEIVAFALPSLVGTVVDPVGAGDALLSYATLTLLETKSLLIAGIVGSMAAAIKCEKDGNNPVTIEEMNGKIDRLEKIAK